MGLIRFLLACIVVLCHTSALFGYSALPADLTVQCFYIISGFYMSLILNEKYQKGSNKLFYRNRVLKIYPIYWLVLTLLIVWGSFVYFLGYPGTIWFYAYAAPLSLTTWLYLIIANILIIGLDLTFILGINKGHLFFTKNFGLSKPNVYLFGFNSFGWTIGIELLFYLIAPFILRKSLFLILLILFGSLLLRYLLAVNGLSGHPWDYMFFPTQLMFFMGGCLSYHIYLRVSKASLNINFLKFKFTLLLAIIVLYNYLFLNTYYTQAFLFIVLILCIPAAFILSKNNAIDRYLGNLSYPIYISQMLIINITRAKAFPKIFGYGFTTLIIVIILSILLEYFITKPIERIRQNPFKKHLRAYNLVSVIGHE
ncbi:acyltransferase [Mucilaginibacter sp.]|uniref:acyltransferase family protein n=1 Tax=Mucilaginibacter sp. TaxID=1882438 RepID=UPI002618C210|nr:acyltransferase [Mucilaginibacter sp.]MDB4918773.1 putative acyltransferase [Mucilaginibacter sp.]